MREKSYSLNLAVVGAKCSGKSALTVRFLTRRFIGEYDSKSDLCVHREINIAGTTADVHIRDTVGSDWLKGPSALIGWSGAIVIVYSITDKRSFDLVSFILNNLKIGERMDPNCVLLLGNKNDLEHLRRISFNQGKQLAKTYGIHFQEISAARDFDSVDSEFRKILFHALSAQINKASSLTDSNESINTGVRKLSIVCRDNPERRSMRRRLRRTSTGSSDTIRDSLSSTSSASFNSLSSEDDRHGVTLMHTATPNITPNSSPSTSPLPEGRKDRKVSLPVIFEKLNRHNNSQKCLYFKVR